MSLGLRRFFLKLGDIFEQTFDLFVLRSQAVELFYVAGPDESSEGLHSVPRALNPRLRSFGLKEEGFDLFLKTGDLHLFMKDRFFENSRFSSHDRRLGQHARHRVGSKAGRVELDSFSGDQSCEGGVNDRFRILDGLGFRPDVHALRGAPHEVPRGLGFQNEPVRASRLRFESQHSKPDRSVLTRFR